LDSYGAIIDELMLRGVKELKEKLTSKSQQEVKASRDNSSDVHQELISKITGINQN